MGCQRHSRQCGTEHELDGLLGFESIARRARTHRQFNKWWDWDVSRSDWESPENRQDYPGITRCSKKDRSQHNSAERLRNNHRNWPFQSIFVHENWGELVIRLDRWVRSRSYRFSRGYGWHAHLLYDENWNNSQRNAIYVAEQSLHHNTCYTLCFVWHFGYDWLLISWIFCWYLFEIPTFEGEVVGFQVTLRWLHLLHHWIFLVFCQ